MFIDFLSEKLKSIKVYKGTEKQKKILFKLLEKLAICY